MDDSTFASSSLPRYSEALEDILTLVLVTSPVRSNPSTEMIEWVLQSYVSGGGLGKCQKIIVSDGFETCVDGQKPRIKHGRVPLDFAAPYAEFRDCVDKLISQSAADADVNSCFSNSSHVRMPRHRGFGGCVQSALWKSVTTPYILVLQHDRPCLRPFSAEAILMVMKANLNVVKYVGLPTKASLARCTAANVEVRCGIPKADVSIVEHVNTTIGTSGFELKYLLFWYDSAHFCSAAHYREFVFSRGRIPGGGFPEDSLGQAMHAEICTAVIAGDWRGAHSVYGTYLYDDDWGPLVGHLRGRTYTDASQILQRGWKGPERPSPALDEEADVSVDTYVKAERRGFSRSNLKDVDSAVRSEDEEDGELWSQSFDLWDPAEECVQARDKSPE
jgi:hypothetical protein